MFSNRIFRTTDELDFIRGPMLAAYLRFEILLWGAIAVLSLVSIASSLLLTTPTESGATNPTPALLGVLAFSLGALLVLIAVWRFKKWGVIALAVWTVLLLVGMIVSVISPQRDWFAALALVGFIVARALLIVMVIRPRWSYFQNGFW